MAVVVHVLHVALAHVSAYVLAERLAGRDVPDARRLRELVTISALGSPPAGDYMGKPVALDFDDALDMDGIGCDDALDMDGIGCDDACEPMHVHIPSLLAEDGPGRQIAAEEGLTCGELLRMLLAEHTSRPSGALQ